MSNETNAPIIVGFVSDLLFTTKIANVARHLGYRMEWVEKATDLGEFDERTLQERPGELLYGREGKLFAMITRWQPALLLFDLTNEAIPWHVWIQALKASPSTRNIPILCFGPHESVEIMQRAKKIGANAVVARSKFTADLPHLLQKYTRIPDYETLQETCQEPLSELAVRGIEMFNQGHYYKCHDDLEEAWVQDQSAGRNLYKAILQVAITYYQIERGNYRGALKLLMRVRQWLVPLPDTCRGVNVARLRQNVQRVQEALTQLEPHEIDQFDRNLFQSVEYTP